MNLLFKPGHDFSLRRIHSTSSEFEIWHSAVICCGVIIDSVAGAKMTSVHKNREISKAALQILCDFDQRNASGQGPVFAMGRRSLLIRLLDELGYIRAETCSSNFGQGFVVTEAGKEIIRKNKNK